MRKLISVNTKRMCFAFAVLIFALSASAQVPLNTQVVILKSEDARAYGKTLETLMASPNAQVRSRAALAAGRIGDERALTALSGLLKKGDTNVRAMAAFAIGEIES